MASFKIVENKNEAMIGLHTYQKSKIYYLMNAMKYLVAQHEHTMKNEFKEIFSSIKSNYEEYAFSKLNTQRFFKRYHEMVDTK